jgi:hypothetical protein
MRKASRCFLLAMTVMASAAGSAFAGEDEDEPTFEEKIIKKVLRGIGPRIEYRDRSPLVIPPTRDLPPPESATVVDNPNWPKDPDKQPKKKAGAKGNLSDSVVQAKRDRGTLSPDEIAGGRVAGAGRVTEPRSGPLDEATESGRPLSPDKLGTGKKWFDWNLFGKPEQAPFEQEPERSSLTQPPPGYQTPSPNYPYGLGGSNKPLSESTSQAKDPAAR